MAEAKPLQMLNDYRQQHGMTGANWTSPSIERWLVAMAKPEKALKIIWEFKDWLKNRSQPVPDLVQCAAYYGHTRFLLNDWTLPIDVPESEFDKWRDADYHMTLEDFQERLAGVVGGVLNRIDDDPQLIIDILKQQLEEKFTQLEELADLPLTQYTPATYPDDVELDGDEEVVEENDFNRPFLIYEELVCFEWAIEKFRMLSMTEMNPRTGQPDKLAYDALMQLDLNALLARLAQSETKLRRILNHLAKHNYWRLDNESEADNFWWRHWRKETEQRRQGRRDQRS
jgi:hypothetical protein